MHCDSCERGIRFGAGARLAKLTHTPTHIHTLTSLLHIAYDLCGGGHWAVPELQKAPVQAKHRLDGRVFRSALDGITAGCECVS